MATGKVHKWLCKHKWRMRCPSPSPCRLLDDENVRSRDGEDWHSKHNRIRMAIRYEDGVDIGIETIKKEMAPFLDEFCSMLPNLNPDEVQRCWTAHFVVDHGCPYRCHENNQEVPDNGYGHIKDQRFWDFLTEVGFRLLAK